MSRRINSSQVKAYKPPITGVEYPKERGPAAVEIAANRYFASVPGTDEAVALLDEYIRLRAGGEFVADVDEEDE